MDLINLLIDILIAGVILYAVYWFLGMIALPQQLKNIILFIIGLIAIIWLLGLFTGGASLPTLR
jgi:hypothetical protein